MTTSAKLSALNNEADSRDFRAHRSDIMHMLTGNIMSGRHGQMKLLFGLFLIFNAALASASDMAKIAGKYRYEKYQVTLKDGRVLHFQDLGSKGAIIEFRKDATIVMSMYMLDGKTITTIAHIKEIKIKGSKGYWIAQWPDMSYPVRKDFSFHDNVFEYDIKFENKGDHIRYGAVEHALLRKTNAF